MTAPKLSLEDREASLRLPAHTNDPDTAVEAARLALSKRAAARAVLSAINTWPITADELDLVFPAWNPRNAARRCSDLHASCLIEATGRTRPTRANGRGTVWKTTPEGRRLAVRWSGIRPRQLVASGLARHRAGLAVAVRPHCPFDHTQHTNDTGLKQHYARYCDYVEVIR